MQENGARTPVNDSVNVVEIRQAFQHGQGNLGNDGNVDSSHLFVYPVKRTSIHVLDAYANVGFRQKGPIRRDDVRRVALVEDLEFSNDLLADGWFGVYKDDLGGLD